MTVPRWELANCLGVDPAVMFPDQGESLAPARALCAGCVIRNACGDFAIDNGENFGVWGGMSVKERARIRRQRRAEQGVELGAGGRPRPSHGSGSRYQSGCRCDECRTANSRRQRRMRAS